MTGLDQALNPAHASDVTTISDIVPDSERRGFIGALPPRLRPAGWPRACRAT